MCNCYKIIAAIFIVTRQSRDKHCRISVLSDHCLSWCLSLMACTTEGSASVEVSPRSSISPAATLRRIRRIILPDRVFGKPGVICVGGWTGLMDQLGGCTSVPIPHTTAQQCCARIHSHIGLYTHQELLGHCKGTNLLPHQTPQAVCDELLCVLHTIPEDNKCIDSCIGGGRRGCVCNS